MHSMSQQVFTAWGWLVLVLGEAAVRKPFGLTVKGTKYTLRSMADWRHYCSGKLWKEGRKSP